MSRVIVARVFVRKLGNSWNVAASARFWAAVVANVVSPVVIRLRSAAWFESTALNTVPPLWSTIQVAWVYLGIAAFDGFALINLMTVNQGGPNNATQLLSMEIFRTGFMDSHAGYSSAIGVVLFFLTLTFAALTLRVTRRDAVEA